MPPTLDSRLATVEQNCRQCSQGLKQLRSDFYDVGSKLGIRTKVLILWYGSGFLLWVLGIVVGYVMRSLGV